MGSQLLQTADSASNEDVIDSFHEIVLAAEVLTGAFHRRMPSVDGHGLAIFALRDVERAGRRGLSQVDIARLLHRSSSSATRLIDALQQANIVQRTPHPNDRRMNMITLTDHGKSVLHGIVSDMAASASALRSVGKAGIETFRHQLSQSATAASRRL